MLRPGTLSSRRFLRLNNEQPIIAEPPTCQQGRNTQDDFIGCCYSRKSRAILYEAPSSDSSSAATAASFSNHVFT